MFLKYIKQELFIYLVVYQFKLFKRFLKQTNIRFLLLENFTKNIKIILALV